ncbi:MAG: ATP-binding protein [Alcanivoracaceae bacterium]
MSGYSAPDLYAWRQRLVMLRGLVVVILGLLFALAWSHNLSPLPVVLVLFWLTLLWLPSLLFLATRRVAASRQQHLLSLELTLDVLLFLGFVYQLGGAGNPVIFYLLVPVLIAALSLSLTGNALVGALACSGYFIGLHLMAGHSHQHLDGLHDISAAHGIGMWLVFLILAIVFSFLGQALQQAARQQHRQQATALSLALQRERMYQIAADLADRAHELNTPLTTLMLLTEDPAPTDHHQLQTDWAQIHQLTLRMATILKADDSADSTRPRPLSALCADLEKNLRMLSPLIRVRWHGATDPTLTPLPAWQRILANLGYNACDAGATSIEIRCERDGPDWLVQVSDDGPRRTIPQSPREGLGIGLALIETTLSSLGGSLELIFDHQWTIARMRVPHYLEAVA